MKSTPAAPAPAFIQTAVVRKSPAAREQGAKIGPASHFVARPTGLGTSPRRVPFSESQRKKTTEKVFHLHRQRAVEEQLQIAKAAEAREEAVVDDLERQYPDAPKPGGAFLESDDERLESEDEWLESDDESEAPTEKMTPPDLMVARKRLYQAQETVCRLAGVLEFVKKPENIWDATPATEQGRRTDAPSEERRDFHPAQPVDRWRCDEQSKLDVQWPPSRHRPLFPSWTPRSVLFSNVGTSHDQIARYCFDSV